MDSITIFTRKGEPIYIDSEDYERVSQHTWHLNDRGYPVSKINGHNTRIQRFIMCPPQNMVVDHINHNVADNRKTNLRICTTSENQANRGPTRANSTGFKGVFKSRNKFKAMICKDKKIIHLGTYETKEKAFIVYMKKSMELFGEYSPYKL